jgi:enamine deaminase RidA (YjgF/YER057c/UK114 family)
MVLTAAAGVQKAQAEKAAGNYQASVAEQNAKLNDFRAEQAGQIGAMKENAYRDRVRQMAGAQRTVLAANGIDLGSGTATDLVSDTYTLGEQDALTIRFNAMNEAWGYRTQAVNDRNSGTFAKFQGKNAAKQTYLTTSASIASQGYGGYASGTFGGKK